MFTWPRILICIVFVLCSGIAWAVFDIRRNLKKIKIAEAVVIDTGEGDKILEAVQVVGMTQIKYHELSAMAIEGVRSHVASNHDELDGELRRIAEVHNALAREITSDNHRRFEQFLALELDKIKSIKKDDTP